MDWNDLRYLLAVADAGTLAGAARSLGVEHSTVGRRLAALETALGARLVTRGPDGFTLTRCGAGILPLARAMAEQADAIHRRVAGDADQVEGVVRLTISEALSGYFVKQLGAIRERHPRLVVEVLSGNRTFDLLRGEADLAVRVREVTEPSLVARKVSTAAWALYASQAYLERKAAPKRPDDLRGHDVIGFDETLAATPGGLWQKAHAAGANIVFSANSIVAALNAAIVGFGVAAIPCFLGDPEPTLRRVTPGVVGSRDVFLVVHPDLANVARMRAVMDFIVEVFDRDRAMWTGEAKT